MKFENLNKNQLLKRKNKITENIDAMNDQMILIIDRLIEIEADEIKKAEQLAMKENKSQYEKYVKGRPQSLALKKAKHTYYLKMKAKKQNNKGDVVPATAE